MEDALGVLLSILVVLGMYFLLWLPQILHDRKRRNHGMGKLWRNLDVRCARDTLATDEGLQVEVLKVIASGAVIVPFDNCPCWLCVAVMDVTDQDAEGPLPVISLIPDLSDEKGFLSLTHVVTVPYTMSTFTDMQVALLIPDAMVLPKRGKRKLRIRVRIEPTCQGSRSYGKVRAEPTSEGSPCYGKEGSTILEHHQEAYGYMELDRREIDANRALARLAAAVCAADGRIDQREAAAVRRFFQQRLAGRDNREELRTALNDAFRHAAAAARRGSLEAKATCQDIAGVHGPQLAQVAYELCVQIVAADERVVTEESELLRKVAQALRIPDGLVAELGDRFLAISMFEDQSPRQLLGLPSGLPREEQVAFLNREYQKWRSRVTHKDQAIRAEAEMRLKMITKLRCRIEETELRRH